MMLLDVIIAKILVTWKHTLSCLQNSLNVVVIMNLETMFAPLGLRINFGALIAVPITGQATSNVKLF